MGRIGIFTVFSLPIHKCSIYLHLFRFFFIFLFPLSSPFIPSFFPSFLLFSVLHSFQHAYPVHVLLDFHISFSFFWAIGNGIEFLLLGSTYSLLLYKNITDFCMFSCISWPCWTYLSYSVLFFFSRFLGIFSVDNNVICKHFNFCFLICMGFTSFSCLLALASIFNTILDNSGMGRHPWIVLSLRKKAFCHWPLSIMLALNLFSLYILFIKLRKFSSIATILKLFFLNYEWVLNFVSWFFCIIELITWCFFSSLVC